MRRVFALVLSVALASGATLLLHSPARADLSGRTEWVATPNGLVGVQQTVMVRAPLAVGQVATITFTHTTAGSNAGQAVVGSQGFAYLPWTPNLPGAWTITANAAGASAGTSSITVAAMPTRTVLLAPSDVVPNRPVELVAEVQALAGSIIPSGSVTVRDQASMIVATGTVSPSGTPRTALANISWTPRPGVITLIATFTPASPAFSVSTSVPQSPMVGDARAVSLQLPPISYVGVPETVSAVIQPAFQSPLGGSVAFNLNIDGFVFYPMGGSRPAGSGVGSTTWMPTQAGVQTVGVQYASGNFAINGTDTQVINVQPAPAADIITVIPTGVPAWGPGNVGTLQQGNAVELTPSSQSGNPVTLTTDGPCAANAGTVTMLGPGTCSITASSVGNGGSLTPAQQTYTVTIQAATRQRR